MTEYMDIKEAGRRIIHDSNFWFGDHGGDLKAQVIHFALGIAGEAGEVADIIKKMDVCDFGSTCDKHAPGKHDKAALGSEIADLLTYVFGMASILDIDIPWEMEMSRAKNVRRWGTPPPMDRDDG